jgi:protein-S-isoprenylcysteine O-methyltransferase Ste14
VNTFRYVLAVLLVIGLPPGLVWWFFVHPFVGFWRRIGARWTMAIMVLFFVVSLAGLASIRDPLVGADLGTQWPLVGLGLVLGAGAMVIGIKRKKYLSIRILAGMPEVETEPGNRGELLQAGPYAVIRHPRYIEVILATFANAAIANYVGAWVLAVLLVPVIHLIVVLEERELQDRFGDAYHAYTERVPRYFPKRRS